MTGFIIIWTISTFNSYFNHHLYLPHTYSSDHYHVILVTETVLGAILSQCPLHVLVAFCCWFNSTILVIAVDAILLHCTASFSVYSVLVVLKWLTVPRFSVNPVLLSSLNLLYLNLLHLLDLLGVLESESRVKVGSSHSVFHCPEYSASECL